MAAGEFWKSYGTPIKVGVIVLGIAFAGWRMRHLIFGDPASAKVVTSSRYLIDIETGEHFPDYRIPDGEAPPYENPKTGKRTLVQAETCWWNTDGSPRNPAEDKPTYVLLNQDGEPTYCPDCGRLVVGHNPMPKPVDVAGDPPRPVYDENLRPPPTEEENNRRRD